MKEGSLARHLITLTKPAITRMVLVTMMCGALSAPGHIAWSVLALAMLGTVLVVGGANALNMYLERESDKHMKRTRTRPLPAGLLAPSVALTFGLALGLFGTLLLALAVNLVTAALAAFALVSYVWIYTPLKRVSPWALHAGAVPGAIPPVLGYTAVTGRVDASAFALFLILFLWQIPHFLAISIFRQSEYEAAGIRVLPAVSGLPHTVGAVVFYSLILVLGTLAPLCVGLAGPVYAVVALTFGSVFMLWALIGLRAASTVGWARSLFFASMPYLIALYAAIVAVNV
ncbi:MAG: heme o synthase [Polyangiaceae bacterium]|nr:heme o synthase [Polyangiaceae bacterium]